MSKALKVGMKKPRGTTGMPLGSAGIQDLGEGKGFQSRVKAPTQRRDAPTWHPCPSFLPAPRVFLWGPPGSGGPITLTCQVRVSMPNSGVGA